MKSALKSVLLLAGAGAVAAMTAIAVHAAQVSTSPMGSAVSPFQPKGNCATGFYQTASSGTPGAGHAFTCTTPVIKCPAPTPPEIGGMATPTAQSVSGGARFSYTCTYQIPPK